MKRALGFRGILAVLLFTVGCGGGGGSVSTPAGTVSGKVTNGGIQLAAASPSPITPVACSGVPVRVLDGVTRASLGATVTDATGQFQITGVPAGTNRIVNVRLQTNQDLNGDGQNDTVDVNVPVQVEDSSETTTEIEVDAVDADGNGADDSLESHNSVQLPGGGTITFVQRTNRLSGVTTVDSNGNGEIDSGDDSFDDPNGDGEADGTDDNGETEVTGFITAIGTDSITVDATVLAVTPETVISKSEGVPGSLSDLAVGDFVEAKAATPPGGVLTALRIHVEDDTPDDDAEGEVEVTGIITAIGADSITVDTTVFALTPETVIELSEGVTGSLADLAVGDTVEVKGTTPAGGVLTALRIHVEDDTPDDDVEGEVEVTGIITAIGANSITVDTTVFTVTPETVIELSEGVAGSLADLAVGDTVEVKGTTPAGGVLTALEIDLEDGDVEGEVEVTGIITAIGADSITVDTTVFAVTPETVIELSEGVTGSLSDLAVGDTVEVKGTTPTGGVLTALEIEREDDNADGDDGGTGGDDGSSGSGGGDD